MFHAGHDLFLGCSIARQLIGHNHTRNILQALRQLTKELLRRFLVPFSTEPRCPVRFLFDPQHASIVFLTTDSTSHFIQMPFISWTRAALSQLVGILLTALPDRLIANRNASHGHDLFHIPHAHRHTKVQPHAVADDLTRKAVTIIRIFSRAHLTSIADKGKLTCQYHPYPYRDS